MTPEQINVAIAEECGWKRRPDLDWVTDRIHSAWDFKGQLFDKVPDFCNDLNAVHKAELDLIFTKGLGMVYGRELQRTCSEEKGFDHNEVHLERWSFSATAYQRSKTILKTLNKWKEQ